MTREEKQKAIDALKISAPVMAVTQEEFSDYIQTLNKVMNWLEQEPTTKNDLGVDCISRQAVLDLIADYDLSMGQVVRGIHALPSVTPQEPRWIPVSERLPEPNRLVLCYITTGATETYFLALWNDTLNAWEEGIGGYRLLENDLGYEVIAWMPLPKPYEAESENP